MRSTHAVGRCVPERRRIREADREDRFAVDERVPRRRVDRRRRHRGHRSNSESRRYDPLGAIAGIAYLVAVVALRIRG
jgi:hypothetical protein